MSGYSKGQNGSAVTWTLPVILIAVFVVVIVGIFVVNGRLDSLEDQLGYKAPAVAEPGAASEGTTLSGEGRAVYVPVYSHIYSLGGKPLLLETTLSVRNTDLTRKLVVSAVRYFNTEGREVRSFLDRELTLGPLASAEFLIEAKDTSGGSGANFIVEWSGDVGMNEPVIEAVMVGMDGAHGVAFVGQTREIDR